MIGTWTLDNITLRLQRLAGFLEAHRHLWSPRSFVKQPLPWEADHPEVAGWLRAQTDERIREIDLALPAPPPDAPAQFREWATRAERLSLLTLLARESVSYNLPGDGWTPRLRYRIPGRKWTQLSSLIDASLHRMASPETILDWCAGKGHLGRTWAAITHAELRSVEREAHLVDTAGELADRARVDANGLVADVLEEDLVDWARGTDLAAGLHACGALTDRLLDTVIEAEIPQCVVVMCCYHFLGHSNHFEPTSRAGRSAGLSLEPHDLRLAIYDEVVAPQRVRRQRRREMAWRAGWDLLMREVSGEDRYHTPGNLSVSAFQKDFRHFAEELAERNSILLPEGWDPAEFAAAGKERARISRALGTVRALFRRPLEVWLVLDRAARLAEAGYQVQTGTFCQPDVTPRNIAIIGRRP